MTGSDAVGETRRLATFCSELAFDDLPEDAVSDACLSVADTIAAGYAGVTREEGERMLAYARTYDGLGPAAVWGTELRTLPEFAALTNGTTAHVLEVDDGHRAASAHPGTPVVPAVLAMATEDVAVDGRDLITAVVAGYEAMCTVAASVQPSHRRRGFHATGTTGCFGAAAGVASLLGLDAEATAHALGLAGTQAGGLFEFLAKGSMAKRFHPGRAAMAGIVAGRAARAGVDGPDTVVEGTDGFARAYADDFDPGRFDALGDPLEVTRRYVKPYPCCRHIHGPIDAALAMLDRGLDSRGVTSVRVETYENAAVHDKVEVENVLDAQMSIPYSLAVTLESGEATLDRFDPPRTDARIRELADLVEVVVTDEMESRYPETRPARLIVETDDGETLTETVDYPLGAPENPLSRGRFERKFHDLAGESLSADRRDAILEAAFSLPDRDADDLLSLL